VVCDVRCCVQKHNRRKAAKEHVRQKLQEHTGLTPQPDLQADSSHAESNSVSGGLLDRMTKVNKCCVSFKLSSPGSVCSCWSTSAEGVLDVVVDDSKKDLEFVPDIADGQDDNLPVNSDSLWPESDDVKSRELLSVSGEASQIKPICSQPDMDCSLLACHSISDECIIAAAVECCDTDQPMHAPLYCNNELEPHLAVATCKNASKQCQSDLRVSEKSDVQETSSLIAGNVTASCELEICINQNTSVAQPVISSGCDLNFSFMDEDDLFACFTDDHNYPTGLSSSKTDMCKQDVSTAHNSIEFADNAKEKCSLSVNGSQSLCQALMVVKIAVAECVNSGVTDFALADSEYGEIIQQKVNGETVEKSVEWIAHDNNEIGSSSSSSSSHFLQLSQSSAHQPSRYQLRQKQWSAQL